MKVALRYSASIDHSHYGKAFHIHSKVCDEYYLPIDSEAKLPVGSVVDILDPETDQGVQLVVKKWLYVPDDNLLILQVFPDDHIEISPANFVKYIRESWIAGALIQDAIKP